MKRHAGPQVRKQQDLTAALEQARHENALVREIDALTDIEAVLDCLVKEVVAPYDFDGYLITLRDESCLNLVCERIELPGEHKKLEGAYLKCNFPLSIPDPNVVCYLNRQPLFIDKSTLEKCPDPVTAIRFERWCIDAMAVVPIFFETSTTESVVIGTLMLLRRGGAIDKDIVESIRRRLPIFENAIRNALAHTWLKRREKAVEMIAKEQGDFLQFITSMSNATSPDSIYTLSCREFLRRFNFDLAVIFMCDEKLLRAQKISVRTDRHAGILHQLERYYGETSYDVEFTDGIIPVVYMQNKHYLFPDAQKVMHLQMAVKDRQGLTLTGTPRTSLVMPIRRQGQAIGVLWMLSVDDVVVLSDADLKLIELVSEFIGAAVDGARVRQLSEEQTTEIELLNKALQSKVEALNELALRDWLTGLNNYGCFEQELSRRVDEYKREEGKRDLSMILIDIDHFKQLNDSCGHVAGNKVLQEMARRLGDVVRTMDFTARYGGEEFAVILPKCGLADAQQVGEKIRRAIAAEPFQIDGRPIAVTVSVGCSSFSPKESADMFIKRTDRALYEAKRKGRNRVEIASDFAAAS